MRNQIIFLASFFTLSILALTSCNKDTNYPINDRNNFLVDKIYSYNNDLVAEYHYDNENKLIKKTVTEHLGQNFQMEWSAYSDEFEYQDDLVSKIIHKDITYNTFNYETYIFYNSKQEIIKMEQYRNGQLIDSNSGYRYENGRLVGIWNRPDEPFIFLDTIEYNKSRNVAKYTFRTPDRDPSGNFIPHTNKHLTHQVFLIMLP